LNRNIVVQYSAGPIITLHGQITANDYVVRLGNHVHSMIQTLFPNKDSLFQEDDDVPIHSYVTNFKLEAYTWLTEAYFLFWFSLDNLGSDLTENTVSNSCLPIRYCNIYLAVASRRAILLRHNIL
jgi:hypothetical protein